MGSFRAVPSFNQPQENDVVLGGASPPPTRSAVLGGLDGVRWRLASDLVDERVQAIAALAIYGDDGLALLIQALQDESIAVQKAAYSRLCHRREPAIRQALRHYDTYRLFECLYTLRGHRGGITALAVSPDGAIAISASRDATLRVWDLRAQEEMMVIPESAFVYAIAIHPDRQAFTAKVSNHTIKAWSLRNGQPLEVDDLTARTISSVTVTASKHRTSRHLISGSQKTIKIWDLQTGREVITLRGHTSLVTAVAAAPKAHRLASGSEDRTIKIWGVA
jgi:WD40 repeat protein